MQPYTSNDQVSKSRPCPAPCQQRKTGRAVRYPVTLLFVLWTGSLAALPSLNSILNPIRQHHRLPALAAAVVVDGEIVASGAIGVRKEGSNRRVRLSDRWHIGSCTKSMTAALAALLIQEGRFQWTTPMGELFPELRDAMQAGWRSATLEQLLKNQAGAPENLDKDGLWTLLWLRHALPGMEQRSMLARVLLTQQTPQDEPGSRFRYSNAGFALAGHAIELKLGAPWETLLVKRLTRPIGLRSVGFGCTASPGKLDGPWGHHRDDTGLNIPDEPGLDGDNPAAIGPGGTVHCTILDLARYARWHLRGARARGTLLRPETFARLHTPYQGGGATTYAGGWNVVPRDWGDGEVLTHNGSNTKNFAVIWIAPKRNFAVVVCTNLGGDVAAQATDETAAALIRKYLTQGK